MERDLIKLRRRLLWHAAVDNGQKLLPWLLAAISVLFACQYRDPTFPIDALAGSMILTASSAVVWLLTWMPRIFRPMSLQQTAIYLDRRLGHDDRISTSLEFNKPVDIPAVALKWPRPARPHLFGPVFLLVISCALAMTTPGQAINQLEEESELLAKLRREAKEIRRHAPKAREGQKLRKQADRLRRLAQDIHDGKLTRKEALRQGSQLKRDIHKSLADIDRPGKLLQELAKAGGDKMAKALNPTTSDLMQLAKQVQEDKLSPKDRAQLNKALDDALKQSLSSENESVKNMADDLKKAKEALDKNDGKSLAEAIKNLQQAMGKDPGLTEAQKELLKALQESLKGLEGLPEHLGAQIDPELLKKILEDMQENGGEGSEGQLPEDWMKNIQQPGGPP